jgi:hypothetical protein
VVGRANPLKREVRAKRRVGGYAAAVADPYRTRDPVRRCPDCRAELARINVVDRGEHAKAFVGFDFTVDHEAPRVGAFDKVVNTSGVVHGWLCPGCDRVLFYAAKTKMPIDPENRSQLKLCPECGARLRRDRSFCPECDHDFD